MPRPLPHLQRPLPAGHGHGSRGMGRVRVRVGSLGLFVLLWRLGTEYVLVLRTGA